MKLLQTITMKFLEELKAAEKILGAGQGLRVGEMSVLDYEAQIEVVSAVLRRIPQLIEVVEWVREKLSCLQHDQHILALDWYELSKENQEKSRNNYTDYKTQIVCQILLMRELLSKLEEGASKDASEK